MVDKKDNLQIKRIYKEPSLDDGFRVLVDRLWPRGVKKERANIDLWLKEVAPSPELRKWFCHKEERFPEFRKHYLEELQTDPLHQAQVEILQQKLKEGRVTLLYAAKDEKHNHAIVLYEFLQSTLSNQSHIKSDSKTLRNQQ